MLLSMRKGVRSPQSPDLCNRIQIPNKILNGLEIPRFDDTRVVISCWKWFPYLGRRLADLVETAHVAWSIPFLLARFLCITNAEKEKWRAKVSEISYHSYNQVPKGLRFCGWKLGHHSFGVRAKKTRWKRLTGLSHHAGQRGRESVLRL